MTNETVSANSQLLGEDSTGEEWTEMQEMLSVALDNIEDELFELTGTERTHESIAELNKHMRLIVQALIQNIPGNGIPVERDVITASFLPVFLARRHIEKWEAPQEAVHCLVSAGFSLGMMQARKILPSVAGRIAAMSSHAEDREKAEAIKEWYRENWQTHKSMANAAEKAHTMFKVAYTTAYKHIAAEAKKLHSATST